MNGKTIRIFLVKGTPNDIFTAEIVNWTGFVVVSPRTQLAELAKRSEVKRTGVYVLAGRDPNNQFKECVYIGESDKVLERLIQHNKDATKEFWERTVIIISKDDNLTKAHVRYLESRLIQITNQIGRATLANGTAPEKPVIPEPDIADMETFLLEIQTLLPVLGFPFALPVPASQSAQAVTTDVSTSTEVRNSPIFYMNTLGIYAEAYEANGEFIILKGSMARKTSKPSLKKTPTELRYQLQMDGKLTDSTEGEHWVFTENVPFSSPSSAARIVTGTSVNGRMIWKLKDTRQTYAEWQEAQVAQAAGIVISKTKT